MEARLSELQSTLDPIFIDGEFANGQMSVDIRPVTNADDWSEWDFSGGSIETKHATAYEYISVNTTIPVADFKSLQEYIAVDILSWPDTDSFWSERNPYQLQKLKQGLTGESVEDVYDGVPIPALKVNPDGTLIAYQEGRHRAIVTSELGYDRIPVKILIDISEC